LSYHPHVHCVVSAGGYNHDTGQWVAPVHGAYLFPTRVLGRLFRQKLLDSLRAVWPDAVFPKGLYKKDWVIHCQSPKGDSTHIVAYLARYVFRLPLSNGRIMSIDNDKIRYRYRPNASPVDKVLELHPHQFLERYLQHVLPKGLHAVRYWGVWAPGRRRLLERICLAMALRSNGCAMAIQSGAGAQAGADAPAQALPNDAKPPKRLCDACQTPMQRRVVRRSSKDRFVARLDSACTRRSSGAAARVSPPP
jgi:hypothetical protein